MISFPDFNFISLLPTDRRIYFKSGTLTLTAYGFDTFDYAHGQTYPFVPIIRYSVDGGTTWQYGGDPYLNGSTTVEVNAYASDTTLRIMTRNEPTVRTINYEVYGIARDV